MHVPKSGITVGPSKGDNLQPIHKPPLDPKNSPKTRWSMIKGGTTYLNPGEDVVAMEILHGGQLTRNWGRKQAHQSSYYHRVKTDRRYDRTDRHLVPTKWPPRVRQLKEVAAYSGIECERVLRPRPGPLVKFDTRKTKHREETKKDEEVSAQ